MQLSLPLFVSPMHYTARRVHLPHILLIYLIFILGNKNSTCSANVIGFRARVQRQTSAAGWNSSAPPCVSRDYTWMNNSVGIPPCQLAGQLNVLCINAGEVWSLPSAFDASYYYPGSAPAPMNACSCSWASYNVISACSACQQTVISPQFALSSWNEYSSGCLNNGFNSTTYFPPDVALPVDLKIPLWAVQDPNMTWWGGTFNVTTAQNLATQNLTSQNVGQLPPFQKEPSPVGTVVGALLGGVVVVGTVIPAAFYIMRRETKHLHPLGYH